MAKILIVGCGDLGSTIANNLNHEHQVTGLRRSIPISTSQAASGGMQITHAAFSSMQIIAADVTKANRLLSLSNLYPNIIIYCISADAQTDANYQAQYVIGLKNVLATQANNDALQHVFFVSSTRVYGQTDGQNTQYLLDETKTAIPNDFGGERLLEAENALKDFCLHKNMLPDLNTRGQACKSTSMRLSGIYGKGRLYLSVQP